LKREKMPYSNSDSWIDEFDRLPESKKGPALKWLSIIEGYETYAEVSPKKKQERILKDFLLRYRIDNPGEKRFKLRTLYNKFRAYREQGIMGLVDGRGGVRNVAEWPEEAKSWAWQVFLNCNSPAASWCISQLRMKGEEMGWSLPSDATIRRFLDQIPQETKDYYRRGKKFWKQNHVPSVLRDYESILPGKVFVADHAQINIAVKHPSGKIIFPWLTGWADMRSRKMVSWHLDVTPSSDTINISLLHAIEKYGVPSNVLLDNGRDFSSIQFTGGVTKRFRFRVNEAEITGIYKLLGIEPCFAIPGNAKSKPIERFFWTQEVGFQKGFLTYRGRDIQHRPEGVDARIKDGKSVIEWADFLVCLDDYINHFNANHSHSGHGMNGRTPNEVWDEYFKTHPQRRVSPASLRLLMMKSKRVKVGRFGVTAFQNHYRSDLLMEHQGEMVVYRYDPRDLSCVYVYSGDGAFLCKAQKTRRTAWNDEEAIKTIKRLKKKKRKSIQAEREAHEEIIKLESGYRMRGPSGDESDDKPTRSAKVVRLLRTPFDGVQKQIDAEKDRTGGVDQDGLVGYRKSFAINSRRESEGNSKPLFQLTINSPFVDE